MFTFLALIVGAWLGAATEAYFNDVSRSGALHASFWYYIKTVPRLIATDIWLVLTSK